MASKSLQSSFSRSICSSCRQKLLHRPSIARSISTTSPRHAQNSQPPSQPPQTRPQATPKPDATKVPASSLRATFDRLPDDSSNLHNALSDIMASMYRVPEVPHLSSARREQNPEPHHLHVYATKHNCHITLTRPNNDAILSLSCGNIGFRKAGRGTYDAAFQLAAYVMRSIQERGLLRAPSLHGSSSRGAQDSDAGVPGDTTEEPIVTLEVVLRGFGQGREAVTKALLGSEGRLLRGRVVKVSDGTRLKFGGTRSQNPRRLG